MKNLQKRSSFVLGGLMVFMGLVLNKWSIESTLSPDGNIQSQLSIITIFIFQILLVIFGVLIILKKPNLRGKVFTLILPVIFTALVIPGFYQTIRTWHKWSEMQKQKIILDSINHSEDLIQWLTPQLKLLNNSVLNLRLPDIKSSHLFADSVTVIDLGMSSNIKEAGNLLNGLLQVKYWSVEKKPETGKPMNLNLWHEFLKEVDLFEYAKFYIIKGHFLDKKETQFETIIGFEGLARLVSGRVSHINAKQRVKWINHTSGSKEQTPVWLIHEWQMEDFAVQEAEHLLFKEVLDYAIPNVTDRIRARQSLHERYVLQSILDKNFKPPTKWFTRQAHDRHPGIAVVDLDRDGYDDIYVMPQWGKNMFFHNRGDGTFEEIAEQLGLDIENHTSSAIFADFDNDGDADVFLGRTLARSMFLVNENGHFVDRSDLIAMPLPYLVSSVSAVDYNNDGLLDVYFSTYAARALELELNTGPAAGLADIGRLKQYEKGRFLSDFLPDEQSRELYKRFYTVGHPFLDRPGPPNVLLKNLGGGRFVEAPNSEPLQVWRNTYQSTWADFDGDGDMDVYVANDFAPNNLIRNDNGERFVDITKETNTADIGFGMGASWGDFDNDGKLDLYVSNMYSKAGRRITTAIHELDPRFPQLARGNSLLKNGTPFVKVSGLEPPALMVEKAGWSWGGQFLDVNNDGWLDIYVLNGHYTAPKEVEIPFDT